MSSLEERVAYLEGRLEDHTTAVDRQHAGLDDLRQDMRRGFEQVDKRFEQVDGRLLALDQKVVRHFTWLVGIQMAVLVSVVGALVGAYFR